MCKQVTLKGEFTDYAGVTRPFIMAAVSIGEPMTTTYCEDGEEGPDTVKTLSIGVSVFREKNPEEFNEELGTKIAVGKALKKRDHCLLSTDAGLINNEVVKALLHQESEYFKQNPGRYLAGYDKDKEKYEIEMSKAMAYSKLSEEGKQAVKYVYNMKDEEYMPFYEALAYVGEHEKEL